MTAPTISRGPIVLRAGDEDAGRRLDAFLADKLDLPRSRVRELLSRGGVALNGRPAIRSSKGLGLEPGARIEIEPLLASRDPRVLPEANRPLSVLAKGCGWIALDKPSGVPVHPLDPREVGTISNALAARYPEIHGIGEGGLRSGVVHRLDVDTSGVLLFALEPVAWRRLRSAFREHRIEKRYRALVRGRIERTGRAELALAIARHRPARVRVVESTVRRAWNTVTEWRRLEVFAAGAGDPGESASLVEVVLHTGFLHQIRATLAHLGHPVLGDPVYGDPTRSGEERRLMLHAARVRFAEVFAESPDPPDFRERLERLRERDLAPLC